MINSKIEMGIREMMTDHGFVLRLIGYMVVGIILTIALATALTPGDHTRFHARTNAIITSHPK